MLRYVRNNPIEHTDPTGTILGSIKCARIAARYLKTIEFLSQQSAIQCVCPPLTRNEVIECKIIYLKSIAKLYAMMYDAMLAAGCASTFIPVPQPGMRPTWPK